MADSASWSRCFTIWYGKTSIYDKKMESKNRPSYLKFICSSSEPKLLIEKYESEIRTLHMASFVGMNET